MKWLAALYLLLASQMTLAGSIQVESVKINEDEGRYLLDARLEYKLSQAVTEALDSGVAMTFRLQMRIAAEDAPFWRKALYKRRLTYRLSYHALAAVYELLSPDSDRVQRFTTREAALRALGRLVNIPLIPVGMLKPEQKYQLRLKANLDIESLPVPLRPVAYLSSHWTLEGDLGPWPLVPTLAEKKP